jgi:hypothetical protein
MASSKTKTTDLSPAAATEASAGGRKLRWTSLPPAAGVAHRTKRTKANKAATKTERAQATKAANASDKLSALDAAAKVLQQAGQPLNCQELIKAMADQGYWTSPQGKTPAATLYSAILRESKIKGSQSRFQKTSRGHFVYHNPQAS